LTVTVAGAELTLIAFGAKLNAVRVGGVASVAEVTVRVLANPRFVTSVGPRTRVFPAASDMKMEVTVQVPGSPNAGKVAVAELVTEVAAVKLAVAVWVWPVDGLVNTAWKKLAPERSSVSVKLSVTAADAAEVSMEVGVKLKAVMFGGVVS
jgi:hypothetical protein